MLAKYDKLQTTVRPNVNKTTIKIKKETKRQRNKEKYKLYSALLQKSTGETGTVELIIRIY